VVRQLERLGVAYAIGGSLASAAWGVVRATLDADIIAELRSEHADPFVAALGQDFYVDPESVRRAIANRSSFNLVHLDTMFKVDVFVAKSRVLDRRQLDRRTLQTLMTNPAEEAFFITAEDTILVKLDWYRAGGGVSERQWRDVIGVLQVRSKDLDWPYLEQTAAMIGVGDLLERARLEALGSR
jgi:hypothetical protein